MKAIFLTTIMLAAFICSSAKTAIKAPANPPTHVIEALNDLSEKYGDKDHIAYSRKVNIEDNSLTSSVQIIPFQCPVGQGILAKVKAAFMDDKELAYSFTQVMPGELGAWIVGTGDYHDEELRARDRTQQEYVAMSVKNNDNPELRDYYGVVWEVKEGNLIKGKIYIITSRRGDLLKERPKKKTTNASDSNKKTPDMQGRKDSNYNVVPFSTSNLKGNTIVDRRLQAYKEILEMQERQISKLRYNYSRDDITPEEKELIKKRILKLHKQAQRTTDKIEKLISKVP
ncbi:MAG: hypothetical protein IJ832_00525 [Bacteroidaceae bacterium]|nr:hypothetical protein [Bacteroidaceae bacterium]